MAASILCCSTCCDSYGGSPGGRLSAGSAGFVSLNGKIVRSRSIYLAIVGLAHDDPAVGSRSHALSAGGAWAPSGRKKTPPR
jgi:hypothetical protein